MLIVMMLACMLVSAPTTAFATNAESSVLVPATEGGEGEDGSTPVESVNLAIESYTPTSMVSGGDVTLKIVVTNNGDKIENAALSIGGQNVATYGTMESGVSKTYDNTYNVPADKLDKDIEVVLSYTFNGSSKSKSSSFKVAKKAASVEVSTAVKADTEKVTPGSKVKLTFAVENKGNVKIEKATITASELNGGKALSEAFSVDAGGSKVITYTATITETTPIEPILTYTADGKQYKEEMETLTITVDEIEMTVLASVSNAYPEKDEEITFTLSMVNNGNVDMFDLELTTSNGDVIPLTSKSLPAGGTMEATYSVVPEESGLFSFVLKAKNTDSEEFSYTSNMVDIVVQEAPAQDYTGKLSLVVSADVSRYESDNIIKFTLKINNQSESTFTDVRLTEDTLGDLGLGTIDMLYPGEKTFEYELNTELQEDTTYYFKAIAVDPDGYTFVISGNAIEVEIGDKKGGGLGVLVWIIIIILILLIGGGIVLLVLMIREKKAQANAAENRAVSRRSVQRSTVARSAAPTRQAPQRVREPQVIVQPDYAEELVEEEEQAEEEFQADEMPAEEQTMPEELPQRKREKPVAPKRVIRSNDFVDRNNF